MPLIVKPVSAILVKDFDLLGKSDPYCVIMIGKEKQRSRTCQGGGKKPAWTDTFQFFSNDPLMRIQVYDDDTFNDDFIGQGTLSLGQFYQNPMRTENEYIDLTSKGKSAGRLLLSVEYRPPMGMNQGGWGNNQGGWGGNQGGWGGNQGGWGGNQGGWGGNQGGWGSNQGNQGANQGWGGNQGGWGGSQGGWAPNQGGWGGSQGGWAPNQGAWGPQGQGGNQGGWGPNQGNQGGWGGNQGGWNNGW